MREERQEMSNRETGDEGRETRDEEEGKEMNKER
jgi:hypothetical protein